MPRRAAKSGDDVARLSALLDKAGISGRGRRSSLSRWFRKHHDAFAAMLADKEPSWDEVAKALAGMDVVDGQGKPPSAERARKAWWAARRAKAAAASSRLVPPALMPGEIAPAVRAVPQEGLRADASPRPRLDIRPATRLSGLPTESVAPTGPASLSEQPVPAVADAGVAGSAQVDDKVAAELRRVLGQMHAGKISLPKVVS